jgi:hypothetical protein
MWYVLPAGNTTSPPFPQSLNAFKIAGTSSVVFVFPGCTVHVDRPLRLLCDILWLLAQAMSKVNENRRRAMIDASTDVEVLDGSGCMKDEDQV